MSAQPRGGQESRSLAHGPFLVYRPPASTGEMAPFSQSTSRTSPALTTVLRNLSNTSKSALLASSCPAASFTCLPFTATVADKHPITLAPASAAQTVTEVQSGERPGGVAGPQREPSRLPAPNH